MSYPTMVLLAGLVTIGAVLIAQWRLIQARPEHFRTERLRGALYVAILFVSFAVLHWHLARAEREEESCCLAVFEEDEVPPPGGGLQVDPPPAPPRPPSQPPPRVP